jgi:hypothetical protein
MPKDHETTEETKETYYRHKRDLLQTQKKSKTQQRARIPTPSNMRERQRVMKRDLV